MITAPRTWLALLTDWLKIAVVFALAAGGAASGWSFYDVATGMSHGPRVALAIAVGVIGALLFATPYLVVMALLACLGEMADNIAALTQLNRSRSAARAPEG